MGQTLALSHDLSIAGSLQQDSDPAGLARLPAEWQVVDRVVVDDAVIDHAVVGPNGVFAVAIDPDPSPATVADDGLYRNAERVTTPVKQILMGAHSLRRQVGSRLFAYPMLVTSLADTPGRLDRLGVIPAGRIPEAIWSHPGVPLTRAQRMETLWTLRGLTR